MVTKSKLKLAIAAEKGVDFKMLKQKRKHKESVKRKNGGAQSTVSDSDDEGADEQDSEGEEADEYNMNGSVSISIMDCTAKEGLLNECRSTWMRSTRAIPPIRQLTSKKNQAHALSTRRRGPALAIKTQRPSQRTP
jgi:hypothetical protein